MEATSSRRHNDVRENSKASSKFILGDYRSEYKQRLTDIQLSLMMIFELNNIIFFFRQVKFSSTTLNIHLLTITPPDHLHISS